MLLKSGKGKQGKKMMGTFLDLNRICPRVYFKTEFEKILWKDHI